MREGNPVSEVSSDGFVVRTEMVLIRQKNDPWKFRKVLDKCVQVFNRFETAAVGLHKWSESQRMLQCCVEESFLLKFSSIGYLLNISLQLGFRVMAVEGRITEGLG
jgi:hypothetical protein